MAQIDGWLLKELEAKGLVLVTVLMYNQRKGRYTLEVENPVGERLIVKANDKNNKESSRRLNTEIEYYKTYKDYWYLPTVTEYDDAFFVMEKLNAVTVRQAILNNSFNEFDSALISQLEAHFQTLVTCVSTDKPDNYFASEAFEVLSTLIFSGPWDTENLCSPLIRKLNYLLNAVIEAKSKKILESMSKDIPPIFHKIHGDFHLNNILLDLKCSKVYIVDWENHHPGYLVVDFSYCFAQFYALLNKDKDAMVAIETSFKNALEGMPELVKPFKRLNKLYKKAVSVNPRFSGKRMSIIQWIPKAAAYAVYVFLENV